MIQELLKDQPGPREVVNNQSEKYYICEDSVIFARTVQWNLYETETP